LAIYIIFFQGIWGSICIWYLFFIIYSYVWVVGIKFAPGMAGMVEIVFSSLMFYLCIFLLPVIALAPDVTFKCLQAAFNPSVTDLHKLSEMEQKSESMSERSSLLSSCFSQANGESGRSQQHITMEMNHLSQGSSSQTIRRTSQRPSIGMQV